MSGGILVQKMHTIRSYIALLGVEDILDGISTIQGGPARNTPSSPNPMFTAKDDSQNLDELKVLREDHYLKKIIYYNL